MFYELFAKLCAKVGKSPSAVALECGISKPTVTSWKRGGGVSNETLKKVADYFGVPTDYFDETKSGPSSVPGEEADSELLLLLGELKDRPEMRVLMHSARNATPEQIKSVASMLESFKGGSNAD